MHTTLPFVWLPQGQPFKYLGINQIINQQGMLEEYENFSCSEFQIKTFVANLRYSHNTIIGRILLLKSLVASRFIYKLILLPAPPLFLKFLQNLYYAFIWNYKNLCIARTTMEQDFSKGGFLHVKCCLPKLQLEIYLAS